MRAVTEVENEVASRSAVNLSRTTIGPEHLGQSQRSLESWVPGVLAVAAVLSRATENKGAESGTSPIG